MKGLAKLLVGLGVLVTTQVTAFNSLMPTYHKLESQAYKIVEQSNAHTEQINQALNDLEGIETPESERVDY